MSSEPESDRHPIMVTKQSIIFQYVRSEKTCKISPNSIINLPYKAYSGDKRLVRYNNHYFSLIALKALTFGPRWQPPHWLVDRSKCNLQFSNKETRTYSGPL